MISVRISTFVVLVIFKILSGMDSQKVTKIWSLVAAAVPAAILSAICGRHARRYRTIRDGTVQLIGNNPRSAVVARVSRALVFAADTAASTGVLSALEDAR